MQTSKQIFFIFLHLREICKTLIWLKITQYNQKGQILQLVLADHYLQVVPVPQDKTETPGQGQWALTSLLCFPSRSVPELEYLWHLWLPGQSKADFLPHGSVLKPRNPAQPMPCAAQCPTCTRRECACRKSWKPDQFGEVREEQTINSSNGKLSSQCLLSARWHLTKGSHWDAPTKGRKFNFCNL